MQTQPPFKALINADRPRQAAPFQHPAIIVGRHWWTSTPGMGSSFLKPSLCYWMVIIASCGSEFHTSIVCWAKKPFLLKVQPWGEAGFGLASQSDCFVCVKLPAISKWHRALWLWQKLEKGNIYVGGTGQGPREASMDVGLGRGLPTALLLHCEGLSSPLAAQPTTVGRF